MSQGTGPTESTDSLDLGQLVTILKKKQIPMWICGFLCGLFALFTHVFYIPVYEAVSTVRIVENNQVTVGQLLGPNSGSFSGMSSNELDRYSRILQSSAFIEEVSKAFLGMNLPDFRISDFQEYSIWQSSFWRRYFGHKNADSTLPSLTDMTNAIAGSLRVKPKSTDTLEIRIRTLNPQFSMEIANIFADQYVKHNSVQDTAELNEISKFMEGRLTETQARILANEATILKLRKQNKIVSSDSSLRNFSDDLAIYEKQLENANATYTENLTLSDKYKQKLKTGPDEQSTQMLNLLKTQNEDLKTRINDLKGKIQKITEESLYLPKVEIEVNRIKRSIELDYELVATMKRKLSELDIQKYSLKKRVVADTLAPLPGLAARPNLLLRILFFAFVGIFFGAVVAIALELLDDTIKRPQDLEYCYVTNFGEIPFIGEQPQLFRKQREIPESEYLIVRRKAHSTGAMAYKYIRTRMLKLKKADGNPVRVVAVSSSSSGEGKSVSASNLAISLAQLGKATILVDCDFRRPAIGNYFGYRGAQGLAAVLNMNTRLSDALIRDQSENLYILTAGEKDKDTDSTDLLSDERFPILLEFLKRHFTYIILDTPPVNAVADAAIIAGFSDIVIMVASYRETEKEMLLQATRRMLQVFSGEIYGIINKVDKDVFGASAKYDMKYYVDEVMEKTTNTTKPEEDPQGGNENDPKKVA